VGFGNLTTGFLIGLREGVEAALIVAIVLAYVVRTGNGRHIPKIWLGSGAAVILSVALGLLIFNTVGSFEEPYEQLFEGLTMILAAAVVTWMLFWMRRQSMNLRGELQAAVDRVLSEGTAWGLAILAFTAVIREGVETALFLAGQATSAETGAGSVLVGAVLGLGVAVLIGWGFYRGSRAIDLRQFFRCADAVEIGVGHKPERRRVLVDDRKGRTADIPRRPEPEAHPERKAGLSAPESPVQRDHRPGNDSGGKLPAERNRLPGRPRDGAHHPFGTIRTTGRIISSIDAPPCWKLSRY